MPERPKQQTSFEIRSSGRFFPRLAHLFFVRARCLSNPKNGAVETQQTTKPHQKQKNTHKHNQQTKNTHQKSKVESDRRSSSVTIDEGEVIALYQLRYCKGGPNSVSKNHISFRCKKRTQKLASCTFLSWSWQSFPFYYVDASLQSRRFEARRGLGEARRGQARPGRGHATDAKRIGTRTKRGSWGLETI